MSISHKQTSVSPYKCRFLVTRFLLALAPYFYPEAYR